MEEIRSQGCADGIGYSSFWQLEYDFCRKLVCSIVLLIMPVFLAYNLFFPPVVYCLSFRSFTVLKHQTLLLPGVEEWQYLPMLSVIEELEIGVGRAGNREQFPLRVHQNLANSKDTGKGRPVWDWLLLVVFSSTTPSCS